MLACAARPRLRTLLATFSAKYVAVGSPPSAKYVAVGSSAWPRVEAAAVAGRAWAGVEALPLAVCRADALGPTSGSLAVSHSLKCTLKPPSCTVMLRERCDGGEGTMLSFCNAAALANSEPTTRKQQQQQQQQQRRQRRWWWRRQRWKRRGQRRQRQRRRRRQRIADTSHGRSAGETRMRQCTRANFVEAP